MTRLPLELSHITDPYARRAFEQISLKWAAGGASGGGGGSQISVATSLPATGQPGDEVYLTTDGGNYVWDAGAWHKVSPGPQGPVGAAGPQGAQGLAGPQGPPGTNGTNGATGATGPAGATGPMGPMGTVYDSDQIGVIKGWSGKTIPANWKLADGATYTKAAFAEGWAFAKQEKDAGNTLWAYTTTNFTVPNLTDKFILAPGASLLGATGGEAGHILLPAETAMKAHSHGGATGGISVTLAHAHGITASRDTSGGFATTNLAGGSAGGTGTEGINSAAAGGNLDHTHTIPAEVASNGAAHNNMPPFVVVAQIVKIAGAQIDPGGALVGPAGPTGPTGPTGPPGAASTVPGPPGPTGPPASIAMIIALGG